jgi:hypothetical protein
MASWHINDLTAATGAPDAESDPAGYVFDAQGTQHVIYTAGNDVHELWWDANGWHHNDLTAEAGAPAARSNPAGDPAGYVFNAQGTQHVVYSGADNDVHELWWDANGWHHNDLTAATGAPAAWSDPAGYVLDAQGTQHVVYSGVDNDVHELWWDANGWHHNDLTAATNVPTTAFNAPAGYVFRAQGTQHVVHQGKPSVGSVASIHELWWDANGWHHNDLTAATGAPLAAEWGVHGYMFDVQGTQHVLCVGSVGPDAHAQELWWDANGWHQNDLNTAAGVAGTVQFDTAGPPFGYSFNAQGTQHVVYRGRDNHIHELWWG